MTVEKLDDRLLSLFAEWKRLRKEQGDRREETPEAEAEMRARGKHLNKIEKQIARFTPSTSESAAALVQVLIYWAKHGGPSESEQERMLKSLLGWIESVGEYRKRG